MGSLGALLGLVAGYRGGWLDAVLMRLTDGFLSFPIVAAAMVMVSFYGVEIYINPRGVPHYLPARQESIVMAASDVGAVVVLLATFAFLGLFAAPFGMMEADWGQMLSAARDWIVGGGAAGAFQHWYTYVPVSAAIVLFSVGWNLIGDGLRDALDPQLRGA